MNRHNELRRVVDATIPALEQGLWEQSVGARVTPELQLRSSNCGLATAALQIILREQGVDTERYIQRADLKTGDPGRPGRISHVVLRTSDGDWIDPTYDQFAGHVGLTARAAEERDLAHLYLPEKIAIFDDHEAFAARYAQHIHDIDQSGAVPQGQFEIKDTGVFRGAGYEQMRDFYARLWSPESSESFLLSDQRESFQKAVASIVGLAK